ncbi:hypothetical protein TrLO_g15545 [Triparma laevis f. longispina]|uniref:Phosphoglycerate mutase-like protein n=1 Tax=Triparma laevis f. longispina TaxID=1714387 RepID=A0A9W7FFB1_9STRA|nr:hypothetical protein TrLO_g15545 [Triparma laevis f. longispina]
MSKPMSLPPVETGDNMEIDLPPESPAQTPVAESSSSPPSTPLSPAPPSGPQPRSSPRPKQSSSEVTEGTEKTVYLIRHGVSRHNHHNVNLQSPTLLDASLDIVGVHQAIAIGLRYRNSIGDEIVNPPTRGTPSRSTVDLVCVSPLTRCLETAHHAFFLGAPYDPHETGAYISAEKEAKANKHRRQSILRTEKNKKKALPMLHPKPPPPFLCHDDLREATGIYYPDKRRTKSTVKAAFPYVDFSNVMEEDDSKWRPDKRESLRELNVRISAFFDWLSARPEKTIAVVTHGVWIEECLRRQVPSTLRGGIRVMNADVYQCSCVGHVREEGPLEVHGLTMKKAGLDKKLTNADENERGVKIGGH